MKDKCLALLNSRGVEMDDLIEIVMLLQEQYIDGLDKEEIRTDIYEILDKREVYHSIFTGIAIDVATEQKSLFDKELMGIIRHDEGLYGVDEVLAYGICNLYGSIALTNFGYVDKTKPGIIGILNDDPEHCHTFLDDIVGAIVASAASKLAHTHIRKEELI
ncbi:MAG: phosphatidylglycerophosphatase A [Erysipelothrix sp.]|nr:phosphatidylglycerophosphatase A [Erysipelothrix sp.]